MEMIVETETDAGAEPLASFLQTVQAALIQADGLGQLPDGYEDVTQGFFAAWKRRIKGKLLNNFKRAYVDVLSRQQSSFNQSVLRTLHELAECCGTLAHVQQSGNGPLGRGILADGGYCPRGNNLWARGVCAILS